jgi:hypothetical protein
LQRCCRTLKRREVAHVLACDAKLAALEGDPDRGIGNARAGLVVARSIGDEPFLISQLVRIACTRVAAQSALQVLAWGQPKQGLTKLQAELRAEADFPWLIVGLRGERGVIDKIFEGLNSGTISLGQLGGDAPLNNRPLQSIGLKLYQGLLPGDHAKALEILTAYIQAAKLPPHEQLAALKAIPLPPRPPDDFRYIVSALILPACSKVAEAGLRTRADLLTAAAAIACERYRMANNRWPDSLEEIPNSILPEIPVDPFTGGPIQYRKLPDGVAVYSTGDGNVQRKEQRREAHDPLADLGQGWKLWNPELRGLARDTGSPLRRPVLLEPFTRHRSAFHSSTSAK